MTVATTLTTLLMSGNDECRARGETGGVVRMLRFISTILIAGVLAGHAFASEIPDVVLQYADAFAQSQATEARLPSGRALREEYAASFLQGFTHPYGGVAARSDLWGDAYAQGHTYWRDYPSKRDEILAGYGYVAVELEGAWSRGFERSAFRPDGGDEGEWWMITFGDRAWHDVGLDDAPRGNDPRRVRIVGYLSPKGRYGHLGAYVRKVLVTSANPVDEGHQLLTACPFTDGCRYRQVPSWPSSPVLKRLAPANRFSSR